MRYAPNYDVPPDVSPFVHLPILDLCAHCRRPVTFNAMSVVIDGAWHGPLCPACANWTMHGTATAAVDPHAAHLAAQRPTPASTEES